MGSAGRLGVQRPEVAAGELHVEPDQEVAVGEQVVVELVADPAGDAQVQPVERGDAVAGAVLALEDLLRRSWCAMTPSIVSGEVASSSATRARPAGAAPSSEGVSMVAVIGSSASLGPVITLVERAWRRYRANDLDVGAVLTQDGRGAGAVGDVELGEDRGEVGTDRLRGDEQPGRDLLVGGAVGGTSSTSRSRSVSRASGPSTATGA